MAASFQSLRESEDFVNNRTSKLQPNPPCITWSHKWPPNETRDALPDSVFASIPNEILLRIFQLLSVRDLCSISLVCRQFKLIADQDEIWQVKYSSK